MNFQYGQENIGNYHLFAGVNGLVIGINKSTKTIF